ncbi:MAG: ABC transporter substrate-binding protein [Clostridia bacterium]|nr:ABC transporter substrate-binding protein [Clostridia bacterium]
MFETCSGQPTYRDELANKLASGDSPDIFPTLGYEHTEELLNYLEELSNEPWVNRLFITASSSAAKDGKLFGMPMTIEGYGFIYNKSLFEKAGIYDTPKTLTQLELACKKLRDAGIIPFSNGYAEHWVLGQHLFNVLLAKTPDSSVFVSELKAGSKSLKDSPVYHGSRLFQRCHSVVYIFELTV